MGHNWPASILKRPTWSYKVSYDEFEGSVETVKNSCVNKRKGATVDPKIADLVGIPENFTPLPEIIQGQNLSLIVRGRRHF